MSIGCRDLVVTAGRRELLAVPALDVTAGETVAVLGPNGAGKSTLLRALAMVGGGQLRGEIRLDGRPAGTAALRAAVAAVLQRPILQRATVLDNVAAGLRLRGVRRSAARGRAHPWLAALGITQLADRDARTLSGGEAQRVAIARALAVAPRVLLLDEPLTGLDATTRADLLADLRSVLQQLGAAVLIVTHDRDEARALAQRTVLLINGRIRQIGSTPTVLDAPADLDCAALLGYTTRLPPALTGHPTMLVARPERCRLLGPTAADPPAALVVPGTLRRVVPLGGTTRVDIDTSAQPVSVLTTAEVNEVAGARVRLAVDVDDVRECPPGPGASAVGDCGTPDREEPAAAGGPGCAEGRPRSRGRPTRRHLR
ncbi:MAG TPA: ATP-binding cassette domain-containing protein [Pseudonocardia sp.]|nr:ATP-binding cassette domain-containing protein [Pseudonocardia sp.]